MNKNEENSREQNIVLNNRTQMNLTAIDDIISFDENTVVLGTNGHVLTIDGEELHIVSMSTESGNVEINGKVNGMYFTDRLLKKAGIFKR